MGVSIQRGLAAAVLALSPVVAGAQIVSFAELRNYVKPGDIVSLTDADDEKVRGKISDLSVSSVTLLINEQPRTFPAAGVSRVVIRDSVRNGALIGLVAGAVPGVLLGAVFMQYCENEASSCPAAPAFFAGFFGGIGAGIGAGVDGLIHRTVHIQPRGAATSRVSPVLSADRQGVRLSIRF